MVRYIVSITLSEKDTKNIDVALNLNLAINKSDYIRQAIREKLARDKVGA